MAKSENFIGTASWDIPKISKKDFPGLGTQLEKYSRVFNAVEVNSSFYRTHKAETYEKWAACVPENFRFSVKLLRQFTHKQKLKKPYIELKPLLQGIGRLGKKFGVLLVQLPPSLDFDKNAYSFFEQIKSNCDAPVVVEPRHKSWLSEEVKALFEKFHLAKVLADPEPCKVSNKTYFQNSKLLYYRLHGSPEMYKSKYSKGFIRDLANEIQYKNSNKNKWCIFDNTALGYATQNALELKNERI